MEYIYPAIFENNDNGSYTVSFPDLPGCITEGKNLSNALYMAEDAMSLWLEVLISDDNVAPEPSDVQEIAAPDNSFVNLVRVNIQKSKAVKRTVSIPERMDIDARKAGLSLSKVLQDALKSII